MKLEIKKYNISSIIEVRHFLDIGNIIKLFDLLNAGWTIKKL